MKRFTSGLALAAFVVALTAPLALAQGGTDAAKPAATPAASTTPAATHAHAMHKASGHAASHKAVDINSATKEELMKVPGITDEIAEKIIAGRPYKSKMALVTNKTLTKTEYAKAKGWLVARQAK